MPFNWGKLQTVNNQEESDSENYPAHLRLQDRHHTLLWSLPLLARFPNLTGQDPR
jgi:hypothetical protein